MRCKTKPQKDEGALRGGKEAADKSKWKNPSMRQRHYDNDMYTHTHTPARATPSLRSSVKLHGKKIRDESRALCDECQKIYIFFSDSITCSTLGAFQRMDRRKMTECVYVYVCVAHGANSAFWHCTTSGGKKPRIAHNTHNVDATLINTMQMGLSCDGICWLRPRCACAQAWAHFSRCCRGTLSSSLHDSAQNSAQSIRIYCHTLDNPINKYLFVLISLDFRCNLIQLNTANELAQSAGCGGMAVHGRVTEQSAGHG